MSLRFHPEVTMTLAATSAKKKQLDLWDKISIDNEKVWANISEDNRIDCLEWIAKLLRSAVRATSRDSTHGEHS
jgi:hypothetical protein